MTATFNPPISGTIDPMRSDIVIVSHGVHLSAWHYEAEMDDLTMPRGRPCVVMAHGLGGTKDSGLEPYAERFAQAGADVVLFDYRGFGLSEGHPRQVVDHRRHREDYHAAVAHARALPDVDPDRSCSGARPTRAGTSSRSRPRIR